MQQKPAESAAVSQSPLKSTVLMRDTFSRLAAERRVAQALDEAPTESGPLNPQKLAIQSLAAMRDDSPNYLNRYVSYMETLLWLQQASGETNSA